MLVGRDKLVRTFHYLWVSIRLPVGPPNQWVLDGMNIGCPLLGEDGWNWSCMVWLEGWKNGVLPRDFIYVKRKID